MRKLTILVADTNEQMIVNAIESAVANLKDTTGIKYIAVKQTVVMEHDNKIDILVPAFMCKKKVPECAPAYDENGNIIGSDRKTIMDLVEQLRKKNMSRASYGTKPFDIPTMTGVKNE